MRDRSIHHVRQFSGSFLCSGAPQERIGRRTARNSDVPESGDGKPRMRYKRRIRTAYSAAVCDSTRNPDRALGETTKIRVGVHLLVASFR
ncbi:hypothetical protein FNX44_015090 [Streptomyces sp. OF1]|uniref:Uncharacterized protein n=1 Tax=Streptomyces alkaliterrae TaxID=2213162 RepID=A0A5P0YUP1_9ACTN|nr:hypothetical protein [Streptomyces alkaliterrae]